MNNKEKFWRFFTGFFAGVSATLFTIVVLGV